MRKRTAAIDIAEMINDFGGRREFARLMGVSLGAVHKWAQRNSIPVEYLYRVVATARAQGLEYVTADWIVLIHSVDVREQQKGSDAASAVS